MGAPNVLLAAGAIQPHFAPGVGEGKFLGLRRIFVQISPNLPEKLATFS